MEYNKKTGSPVRQFPRYIPTPVRSNNNKKILLILLILIFTFLGFLAGGYYVFNKPEITITAKIIPTPTPNSNPTLDWPVFSYKNVRFKYPPGWEISLSSKDPKNENGFLVHFRREGETGIQPDEIRLSTFNDRANIPGKNGYEKRPLKKFAKIRESDEDYIEFKVGKNTFYAGCVFSDEGYVTLQLCNQVMATVKSYNLK